MEGLFDTALSPLTDSPWLGLTATGLDRRTGVIDRVYPTPYGDVAVLVCNRWGRPTLYVEALPLLSTRRTADASRQNPAEAAAAFGQAAALKAGRPSTGRAKYLRTQRELRAVLALMESGKPSPGRILRYRQIMNRPEMSLYTRSVNYVQASLIEQVQSGDTLTWLANNLTVTAVDPDVERDELGKRGYLTVMLNVDDLHLSPDAPDGIVKVPAFDLRPTLDLI